VDVVGVLEVSGGSRGANEMRTVTARSGEACLLMFASCNAAEMQPELSAGDEVCRADGNNTVEVVLGRSALTRRHGPSRRTWWRSGRGGGAQVAWQSFTGATPADSDVQVRCSSCIKQGRAETR
jgi:hypothetical protein